MEAPGQGLQRNGGTGTGVPGVCVGEGGVRGWGPSGTACAEARTCAGGPNNDPPPCNVCKDMWRTMLEETVTVPVRLDAPVSVSNIL